MICTVCKKHNEEGSKYCTYCGTELHHDSKQNQEVSNNALEMDFKNRERSKSKTRITTLLIVFLAPIGLIVMWARKHYSMKTRVILTMLFGLLIAYGMYSDATTAEIEKNPDNLSVEIGYLDDEPDWKAYFSIRAYGENIEVTDDMITENVDTSSIGKYRISIEYVTNKNEVLNKSMAIEVIENDLYIELNTVFAEVNPLSLPTSIQAGTSAPDWKAYFTIHEYGNVIEVTDDMITNTVDMNAVQKGYITLNYTSSKNETIQETIEISTITNPMITSLMSINLTFLEARDIYDILVDLEITEISSIEPKLGDSIDTLKAFQITVDDGYNVLMTIEERSLFSVTTGDHDFYFYDEGILNTINDFYIESDVPYILATEYYIENILKAPATAEFPDIALESNKWRVERMGDYVTVMSYVDAQNSFGALIRNYFVVQVDYTSKELLYLKFDDEIYYGTFN